LLIAHGQPEAAIACTLEHERYGETTVTIKLRADGKEAWTDKERVTRLADYLGHFPTVVFTSQDLQLIRGAPAARRRWLDLTLAAMDADYLRVLQTYHRALAERNALLKRGLALGVAASDAGAAAELAAFEQTMAPAAAELVARRCDGLRALADVLTQRYTQIAAAAEPAGFAYAPDFAEASPAAVAAMLAKNRARDAQFRTTLCGPHRDDFEFTLAGHPAKDFASEGQQRSLVIALRLAQAAWFQARSGVRPVLLADDVLGEIDPERRERFWAAIDPEAQVLATGTALPAGTRASAWEVFYVNGGAFAPADPDV
jgi:DNA replication and repair protein RecF